MERERESRRERREKREETEKERERERNKRKGQRSREREESWRKKGKKGKGKEGTTEPAGEVPSLGLSSLPTSNNPAQYVFQSTLEALQTSFQKALSEKEMQNQKCNLSFYLSFCVCVLLCAFQNSIPNVLSSGV